MDCLTVLIIALVIFIVIGLLTWAIVRGGDKPYPWENDDEV
jgi:hypothetical protein